MSDGPRCGVRHPVLRSPCVAVDGAEHAEHWSAGGVRWPNRPPSSRRRAAADRGGVVRRKDLGPAGWSPPGSVVWW